MIHYTAKKTLEIAKKTKNDVIVQVKANQKKLHNDCINTTDLIPANDIYNEPISKTRNRIEQRTARVYNNFSLRAKDKWALIKTIVRIDRHRKQFDTKTKTWKNSFEIAFYLSTKPLTAKELCTITRNHWQIENSNHYVKDVTMNEDSSRIRINPNNFAKLRSFALNIMRANNAKNIKQERYENCMKLDKVLNYFGIK